VNSGLVIVIASVAGIASAAGGYALGASTAPTEEDAISAKENARADAFDQSLADSRDAAHPRGLQAGQRAGGQAGEAAGTEAGAADGSDSASAELAAAEAAAAEQAAAAEAQERAANCGAPLFPDDYCPTDEEIALENQAEALCGPGTAAGREQAAELGIQC
jgi:colicin import membrane protein